MRQWRLCPKAHSATPLDGEGARLFGGRWNLPGTRVVYLAEHLSLAALEVLVHVDPHDSPTHVAFAVDLPDEVTIESVDPERLTARWRAASPPLELQRFGTQWAAERRSLLLVVPSVIVPEERVFVFNPEHSEAAAAATGPGRIFELDPRLAAR